MDQENRIKSLEATIDKMEQDKLSGELEQSLKASGVSPKRAKLAASSIRGATRLGRTSSGEAALVDGDEVRPLKEAVPAFLKKEGRMFLEDERRGGGKPRTGKARSADVLAAYFGIKRRR